uniref:Uncharacterized protein n=1 Tax=Nelumbo nucifera TaxID=4432 RepID=A0A822XZI5_NELNU|nr:TPA_asm: hypothetical protein HUJ06_026617 [Nelumbo nucifera]
MSLNLECERAYFTISNTYIGNYLLILNLLSNMCVAFFVISQQTAIGIRLHKNFRFFFPPTLHLWPP